MGKVYGPVTYAVGREKVREFAHATGETEPLHLDVEAARAAGPPGRRRAADVRGRLRSPAIFQPALFDPEVGIDFARMVHGAQEFAWGPLVVAGDEISDRGRVRRADRARRDGLLRLRVALGQPGRRAGLHRPWTCIVRGG